ncbi:hypothetical protein POM88_025095 [Heracleum sosnowskyi]|uniref:Uncharacterized protein n=1 Tax=Heracleum sosnowskyi TaxID=360622 RepID=A0AAD8I3P2_9APIA|nr:hypothetical protein POM88_025095 [Heracleum sosnowskyi]
MGPPWKLQFLQDVIRQQRLAFVFLCETLSSKKKMEWVRTKVGFQGMVVVEAQGRSGELYGHPFTWERGRDTDSWLEIHLDRAMATKTWFDLFPTAKLYNLEGSPSDHSAISLEPT